MSTDMSVEPKDCLECRLASAGGLIAGSVYVIHHGRKHQNISRYVLMGLGSGLGILGILRLFKLSPSTKVAMEMEENNGDISEQDSYIVGKLPTKF